MEKLFYDLHIHSALSPCAENDMTPNDIVNMALLNGLDLIAVTDHNSFGNVRAVMKAAEGKNLLVLPGAEIETSEEVHVLCYFADLPAALRFEEELSFFFSKLENRRDIYGEQLLLNEKDEIVGEMERMLVTATSISFDVLLALVRKHGGAFVPAHIDKDSYSALSNLGFIPEELEIAAVEISKNGAGKGFIEQNQTLLEQFFILISSDAHYLWDIAEKSRYMEVSKRSASEIISLLNDKK